MKTPKLQLLFLSAAVLTGLLLLASCGSKINAPSASPPNFNERRC